MTKLAVKKVTPQQKPFSLEFLGTMAIMTALLVFMYASTFQPDTINLLTSGILLLVIGVTFAVIMVGVMLKPFSFDRFIESLIWTGLAFGIIYVVNRTVPFTLGVQVLNVQWYSVLMGVAEECFFRLFLTGFMYRVTHSMLFSIIIGAWVWTIYHMARYGGDAGALIVVLFSGFALGFIFLQSRMGDPVVFAHALVNFLATGGSIPIAQGSSGGGQLQNGWLPEVHDWASLGLWALMVTIVVIAGAGIITHLTHRSYQRKPRGKKPKAPRKRLPSGNPKTKGKNLKGNVKARKKLAGSPKSRKKLKGKR